MPEYHHLSVLLAACSLEFHNANIPPSFEYLIYGYLMPHQSCKKYAALNPLTTTYNGNILPVDSRILAVQHICCILLPRFNPRIFTASSIIFLRHNASHGCSQINPCCCWKWIIFSDQTDASSSSFTYQRNISRNIHSRDIWIHMALAALTYLSIDDT